MFLRIRKLVSVLCLLAAAASMTPASGSNPQKQGARAGKLEGVVYSVASGDPLTRVNIEVLGQAQTFSTGVAGDYSISLEPGTYIVRFFREGFSDQSITDVV